MAPQSPAPGTAHPSCSQILPTPLKRVPLLNFPPFGVSRLPTSCHGHLGCAVNHTLITSACPLGCLENILPHSRLFSPPKKADILTLGTWNLGGTANMQTKPGRDAFLLCA